MDAMQYDPDTVTACDSLRKPARYGARVVPPNVVVNWWTYDGVTYSAVAVGPRGRSIVKSSLRSCEAIRAALGAYIHDDLMTYEEEVEWWSTP